MSDPVTPLEALRATVAMRKALRAHYEALQDSYLVDPDHEEESYWLRQVLSGADGLHNLEWVLARKLTEAETAQAEAEGIDPYAAD